MHKKPIKIFILAGETSGDHLGAKLITALKKKLKSRVIFEGIGGREMTALGVKSLFPIEQISMMGFSQVFKNILRLRKLLNFTASHILASKPDIVITIDSPGFNLRLAKKISPIRIKAVHYVSPSVWIYGVRRIDFMAKYYDLVLSILPFEKAYYKNSGLRCEYIGHPLSEDGWERRGVRNKHKAIGVLPGSRVHEIKMHMPIFVEALNRFTSASIQKYRAVFLASSIKSAKEIGKYLKNAKFSYTIAQPKTYKEKQKIAQGFDLALCKSGTSSLELTFASVPTIVAHRLSAFDWFIARHIYKIQNRIKFVSLTNILANKMIIPEYLQDNCTATNLSEGLKKLTEPKFKKTQLLGYKKVIRLLKKTKAPSQTAADLVSQYIS